jgi:L-2-hydroxyglutarate oxidase
MFLKIAYRKKQGANVRRYDVILIGGGIVGVATAWQLKQRYPDAAILLLEKETRLAGHQTGHNSGVIHAGVYYAPGSLKADFCKRGAAQTIAFCQEYGLPYEQCGKLLVATNALEMSRMAALETRCVENGIETRRLTASELKRQEPDITGLGALLVPATGITDYPLITATMARRFTELGGEVRLQSQVKALAEHPDAIVVHITGQEKVESRYLLACGGLMADRLAQMMHIDIDFRIIPFRGEYYCLPSHHNRIVKHLIYPLPDPDLPFLGVHLTRMIDGSVTVGPNAVLGLKREGYGRININIKDLMDMAAFPGFWRVLGHNLFSGLGEMRDSLCQSGYLKRVRKYCPKLTINDLQPYPAGIRAQAVKKDGSLVHDFLFARSERSLHVCNAPSPAATSALPIADFLCDRMVQAFGL